MRFFQLKLTRHWTYHSGNFPNPIVYQGRCVSTENGFIKGFLKTDSKDTRWIKSYVVGFECKYPGITGDIKLAQLYVHDFGKIIFPSSPVVYDIQTSSPNGTWEIYDIRNEESFYIWHNGFDNNLSSAQESGYTGRIESSIRYFSYPSLFPTESAIINKLLSENAPILIKALGINFDFYTIMCDELEKAL